MKVSSALLIFSLGVFAVMASPVEKEAKRLIKTSEQDPGTWMTESEVIELALSTKSFVDITNDRDFSLEKAAAHINAIPTSARFQTVVNELIRSADQLRVQNFVKSFSEYFNRNYQSATGEESQKWLTTQAQASLADYRGNSSVREVDHNYRQNSIVARIEGSDPVLKNEVVIIGAHEDSLAFGGANARAPGADDNGSGSAVVLETLRLISAAGIRTNRTIEFHWYAAEEQGLLGSAAVAREYKANNVNVVAMLNLDVVGYYVQGLNDVGIYTDNGNAQLIQFLRVLVDEYLSFGRRDRTCGYGCSDHASWTNNGYPAAFAAEYEWHPNMHSANDNYQSVGFNQVMEFVKLAVAFIIEMGEPL